MCLIPLYECIHIKIFDIKIAYFKKKVIEHEMEGAVKSIESKQTRP